MRASVRKRQLDLAEIRSDAARLATVLYERTAVHGIIEPRHAIDAAMVDPHEVAALLGGELEPEAEVLGSPITRGVPYGSHELGRRDGASLVRPVT